MRFQGLRPARIAAGVLMAVGAGGCSSSPTVIQHPPLEMLIASGDGQFGVVGQDLSAPLRVLVRSQATGAPREDVSVAWEITQGSATLIGVPTTLTDATGSTEVRLRVGSGPGEISVRAYVASQQTAQARFQLFGVNQPTLTQVTPVSAAAGDTVVLTGTDFSTVADQNVVLFSGIRGRVVSSAPTSLQVVVPLCLPARDVAVSVQLGVVPAATSLALTVTGGGQVSSMQVGDVIDVADDGGFVCHALERAAGAAQYLVLAYSASAVGAAEHPFRFTALSSSAPAGAPALAPRSVPSVRAGVPLGPQEAWDQRLRELEDEAIRAARAAVGGGFGPVRVGPAAVPSVGESRSFNVLNASGGLDPVTAVARHVGTRAAMFVDQAAPPGGFDAGDLAAMAARFDDVIHPQVTGAYGNHSDVDANQRVIILFTPAVNRLTPRGSSGFVGGFFYGIDLLTSNAGSNKGEIFYALVPDPNGQFADPQTKQQVLQAVPAVLAHEFQHMVHFNERVLVRGAAGQEALWLAEGLAQMAEELVARAYDAVPDATSAEVFRSGARARARRYLAGTDTVSLVVTAGQGSLAERGAGFLDILYLEDQGGTDLLGRLTKTTRTGVTNLEAETGVAWADLIANWWSATYLDQPGPEAGPLTYPTLDLRGYLGGSFPLIPVPVGLGDVTDSSSLDSSSVRYYLVNPPLGGSITVRLGGAAGGPSPAQSALRLRLIRIS